MYVHAYDIATCVPLCERACMLVYICTLCVDVRSCVRACVVHTLERAMEGVDLRDSLVSLFRTVLYVRTSISHRG